MLSTTSSALFGRVCVPEAYGVWTQFFLVLVKYKTLMSGLTRLRRSQRIIVASERTLW
jgi:hypothetical protein